jgi:protein-tyrosine phosphatase
MQILMVCLGNICRSPLAEGIMRSKIEAAGLDWEVDSAGTGSWHVGDPPDPRSIDVARKHGLDISTQCARKLRPYDLEQYDRIFAMDSSNYRNILQLALTEEERGKVHMIMNMSEPGMNESVPDPYWDDDGFEKVYQMLNRACEAVIKSQQ